MLSGKVTTMDELGGALRELAGRADAPSPVDPADLWKRGRLRIRRRRFAGAAVAAILAAIVFGGTYAVTPPQAVDPAGTDEVHQPAVPTNVYRAKDWYPGTKDDPPGVVAVVGGVVRDDRMGLFSVSAESGEYRLLDLPGLVNADASYEIALSPDGRHVAYWMTGRPTGRPFRSEGEDLPVGVGVYDTVTGDVVRHLPQTEHGISADELLWVDNEVLMMAFGQRTSPTSSKDIATYSWRPAGGPATDPYDEPVRLEMSDLYLGGTRMPRLPAGHLVPVGARRFAPLGWSGPDPTESVFALPKLAGEDFYEGMTTSARVLLAAVRRSDGQAQMYAQSIQNVEGGVLPERGRVIEALDDTEFVGWLADDRILVLGSAVEGHEYGTLYSYDFATAKKTILGTAEGGMYSPGLSFATDLLQAPMVEGDKPPTLDPRWKIAGSAAGAALVLILVVPAVLRRRRG